MRLSHVGAKSALLRRLFITTAKKTPSARSLAPPFQLRPVSLDSQLLFYLQRRVSFLSMLPIRLSLYAGSRSDSAFYFCAREVSHILNKRKDFTGLD